MTGPPSLAELVVGWQPSTVTSRERVDGGRATSFAALLDQPSPVRRDGDALPPLWHWLCLPDQSAQSELGADGHPRAGAFLPPIPDRRRMFAGGRLTQRQPVRSGQDVVRTSSATRTEIKRGSTGELLFVTVRDELRCDDILLLVDERDIVYRQGGPVRQLSEPPSVPPTPVSSPWQLEFRADPVMLFRFSALTHNAHRIHYDQAYTTSVEGYPQLVVHGPLLALLLLELPRRHAPGRSVAAFTFRARRPAYCGQPVLIHGGPADTASSHIAVVAAPDAPVMTAAATFAA